MAAHHIPCGPKGLPASPAGGTSLADRIRATSGHLQRDAPAGFQFFLAESCAPMARMSVPAPRHIPVLGREAVELLSPRDGGTYVDATFGAGGYSRAILDIAGTRVIGIDRDRSAIAGGFELVDRSDGRLTLVEDRFSNLAEVCAAQATPMVDGVVMDVGMSSMQLDQAERGFSFSQAGPLDMRMGHDGPTAADLIAAATEADLANII